MLTFALSLFPIACFALAGFLIADKARSVSRGFRF